MSTETGSVKQITVETTVAAPIAEVWRAYNSPEDIKQWNAASDDWHTTASSVDLREGGAFSSRMEAKDGSFGFDFAGTYTRIVDRKLIEYAFGDRAGLLFQIGPASIGDRVQLLRWCPAAFDQIGPGFCVPLGLGKDVIAAQRPVVPQRLASIFGGIRIIGPSDPSAFPTAFGWTKADVASGAKPLTSSSGPESPRTTLRRSSA